MRNAVLKCVVGGLSCLVALLAFSEFTHGSPKRKSKRAKKTAPGPASPSPSARRPYVVEILGGQIYPFKADKTPWDGTRKLADVPDPTSTNAWVAAGVLAKKLGEMGLDAIAAPDAYAVITVADNQMATQMQPDSYGPVWKRKHTFLLAVGDYIDIEVIDRDLQEAKKDSIGNVRHLLTQADFDRGTISLDNFGGVVHLDLTLKPVGDQPLLFAPGRYSVAVRSGTISATKPSGDQYAGSAWDVGVGPAPDVFGTVTIGGNALTLTLQANTLVPVWNQVIEVDLDEGSSLGVELIDEDLKTHDPIAFVFVPQLLSPPLGKDGLVHLSGGGIFDLVVVLQPVARPVSASECRDLGTRLATLAVAAGLQADATTAPEWLRSCVIDISRPRFDCAMKAQDPAAGVACLSTAKTDHVGAQIVAGSASGDASLESSRFGIEPSAVSSCGGLAGRCIQVICGVRNRGSAAGEGVMKAELDRRTNGPDVKETAMRVPAGALEIKTFMFDYNEIAEGRAVARCTFKERR